MYQSSNHRSRANGIKISFFLGGLAWYNVDKSTGNTAFAVLAGIATAILMILVTVFLFRE